MNFIEFKNDYKKYIGYILIILGIVVSLKAFYVVYLILVIPLLWIIYKKKKIYLILYTLKHKVFLCFCILITLVVSVYFFNTGCFVYPVAATCFDGLSWSIGSKETAFMNDHYQLWSKAGRTPNFKTENPEIYLTNFNWVQNWIDNYFFNKVSDFFLGILFLAILVICFFYTDKKKKDFDIKNKNLYLKFLYTTFILLFFEWFLNHPSLRYGGYVLFAIFLFFPVSIILQRYENKIDKVKKKISILIGITIIIFFSRNIDRINNEIIKYDYKPLNNPYYFINNNHFRVQNNFNELIVNFKNCDLNLKNCDLKKLVKIKEIFPNRYLFIND